MSPRVYAIVDRAVAGTDGVFLGKLAALLAEAASDGRVWIQLRVKGVAPLARRALLREAAMLIRSLPDVPVLVNGTAAEALQLGFEGVHWPESQRPEAPPPVRSQLRWVCAAAHDAASLVGAHRAGADVATWSAVYEPRSKSAIGRGLEALRSAIERSPLPVLALGGITPDLARRCVEAGAAGVAVLSPISLPAGDPVAAVRALLQAVGTPPDLRERR